MTVSAKVNLSIKALEVLNEGIKAGVIPASIIEDLDLRSGTADGQINLAYGTTATTVAASSTTGYDLAGALVDTFGKPITFAEVVLIALRNKRSTALAYITVGPAAANGFGALAGGKGFWVADIAADADNRSVVGPDSWMVLYDKVGVPVTAGTGDLLTVSTSAVVGDVNTWDLLILGRSA